MATFHGCGSTESRQGNGSLFTIQFLGAPGTQLIKL